MTDILGLELISQNPTPTKTSIVSLIFGTYSFYPTDMSSKNSFHEGAAVCPNILA